MIGFRNYHYGLLNHFSGDTCFFTHEQFSLIEKCDGKHEIDLEALSKDENEFFKWLKDNYFIRENHEDKALSSKQEYILYNNDYKDSVQLSITGNCNCKCRHCFVSAPIRKYRELSLKECIRILDQLKSCGVYKTGLTGGEPLLHPDFKKLIENMHDRQLVLSTLYTNGILLDDDILDMFRKYNMSPDIQISFDGIGTHDWIRGIEGIEEKAVKAIRKSVDKGFFTHISMVLYKGNKDKLFDNICFLDSLGVKSIKVSAIENLGEWQRYNDDYGLNDSDVYETYLQVIPKIINLKPQSTIELGGFFTYDHTRNIITSTFENRCTQENENRFLLCTSLKKSFYINSDGMVYPCVSMISDDKDEELNVLSFPLQEILDNPKYNNVTGKMAIDFFKANAKCNECEYRYQCLGGCRAKAMQNGNGQLGIDQQVCSYYKDGWKKRKDELLSSLINNQ